MADKLYTDEELMKLLAGGGKSAEIAFTRIYDLYSARIKAYCYTVMQDSDKSGDIFQETFIRFYKSATAEEKKGTPVGWLITIARNLCLNAKRDAKPNVPIDKINLSFESKSPMEDEDNQRILDEAMSKLDYQSREAVALRYYEDMPYDSIAELLNITPARARYLVFNAKSKMKKTLESYR